MAATVRKAANGTAVRPKQFLSALIRTGYLPEELPPAVTSKHFAEFCASQFKFLRSAKSALAKRITKFDTFTAPRTTGGRRNLALVHPLSQLGMSIELTEHRNKIRALISKSTLSLYRTSQDEARGGAFEGLNFRKWDEENARVRSAAPVVLKADISRFFYTAYTHSLPWAVVGKEKAKHWLVNDKKKLHAHWSNKLDVALQNCQSRETFGIPVGPDTSRVIAEILLTGVEKDQNFAASIQGRPAARLLDDFIVGFEDEEGAKRALACLRSALWKFNLQLNEEKTQILPSSRPLNEKWKLEFDGLRILDQESGRQAQDIYRLMDLALHYCAESKSGLPAVYACRRLSRLKKIKRNLGVILESMFRLSRDFPSAIPHLAVFLINNRMRCDNHKEQIAQWIRHTIKTHLVHSHDFEVSWSLVVAGVLQIKLNRADFEPFNRMPSSVVFAILGLLNERKLLTFPLSSWPWRSEFKKAGLDGQYWLPFYEAVARGWTKDKSLVRAVNSDPVFAKMMREKVSFLENRVFDTTSIDVARRVFVGSVEPGRKRMAKKNKTRGIAKSWADIKIRDIVY